MIDSKYAMFVGVQLEGFKQIRRNLWQSRCPKCGDSEKKKSKRRFYIYQPHRGGLADNLAVNCHNCEYHTSFYRFLESQDETLFSEYRMELFKERGSSTQMDRYQAAKARATQQDADIHDKIQGIESCDESEEKHEDVGWIRLLKDAPADHPVLLYAKTRLFPEYAYGVLGYCDNFREEFDGFSDEVETKSLPDDARLVIPIRDATGKLVALQGRAIGDHGIRYMTLKTDETVSKVFGLDRLVPDLPVMVVEGPLDSLFLPNCIATADANLLSAGVGDILIPDRQMRNPQLVQVIERMVESDKYVCLMSDDDFPFKDVNAAIQGGWTPSQVTSVILDNIKRGLSAKLKLQQLRKV